MKALVWLASFAVLLAGYTYYAEFYLAEKKQVAEKQLKTVFSDFSKKDIRKVRIGQVEIARNAESQWRVTSPVSDLADAEAIERLLDLLLNAQTELKIPVEGNESAVSTFGKDSLRADIVVETDGQALRVEVSDKLNFEQKPYLFLEGSLDRLYLGSLDWIALTEKSAFELRDQRVFRSAQPKLTRFSLRKEGVVQYEFSNEAEVWVAKKKPGPVKLPEVPLSHQDIESFLKSIWSIRAADFVSEDLSDAQLQKYGLKRPQYSFSFESSPEATFELRVSCLSGADCFVTATQFPFIAKVTDAQFSELVKKTAIDFGDKSAPFKMESEGVDLVELQVGKNRVVYQRTDQWKLSQGDYNPAKSEQVSDLVAQIAQLNATQYRLNLNSWPSQPQGGKIKLAKGDKVVFTMEWTEDKNDQFLVRTSQLKQNFLISKSAIESLKLADIFLLPKPAVQ